MSKQSVELNTNEKVNNLSAEEKRLAATALVDAAIWSQYSRGKVSVNDADREFLIRLMTANPQLAGSLFEKGL